MKQDGLIKIWYDNPLYRNDCDRYINEFKKSKNQKKLTLSKKYLLGYKFIKLTILNLSLLNKKLENNLIIKWLFFSVSIFLRLLCIYVIVYVLLIMINETDSWVPLVNLVFCFGILFDLIYFIKRQKEHTGVNIFLFFYSLGMIPALWFQHEIMTSLLAKYTKQDVLQHIFYYKSKHKINS